MSRLVRHPLERGVLAAGFEPGRDHVEDRRRQGAGHPVDIEGAHCCPHGIRSSLTVRVRSAAGRCYRSSPSPEGRGSHRQPMQRSMRANLLNRSFVDQ